MLRGNQQHHDSPSPSSVAAARRLCAVPQACMSTTLVKAQISRRLTHSRCPPPDSPCSGLLSHRISFSSGPHGDRTCNRRLTPVGRTRRADPPLRTARSHIFRQVSLWGPSGCCKSATIVTLPCLRKCDSTDDCRADTRYTTWPLCEAHRLRFTRYIVINLAALLLRLRHRCRQPACSAASMLPGKAEPPRPIARLPRGWARRNGAGEG